MKRHLKINILFYLTLLSLFIVSSLFPSELQTSVEPEITVYQLNFRGGELPELYSETGLITVGYTPEETDKYFNIIANENTPIWIVQNLYLPDSTNIATIQQMATRINLKLLEATAGVAVDTVSLAYSITDTLCEVMPDVVDFNDIPVDTLSDHTFNDVTTDTTTKVQVIDTYSAIFDFDGLDDFTDVIYRGCAVPNIDLDYGTYPSVTDVYAGDRNACVPASAANSLKWLHDNGDITLPDSDIRNTMEELSYLMERADNQGVTIDNFLKGKLDYINTNSLNINVKFQSESINSDVMSSDGTTIARNDNGTSNYPTWEWLKQQMEDGEDVELCYYWWDGDTWRGHAVVVTGIFSNEDGLKSITFKHDLDQSATGGTVQESVYIFTDDNGRLRIHRPDPKGHQRPPFIGHAVAESPGDPIPSPVELGFFTVFADQGTVALNWRTESESNNYGFDILRNGQKLAFVEGHGTTAKPRQYSYTDTKPVSGMNSYQLFQIDFDGSREKIAQRDINIASQPAHFSLGQNYPNPFNNSTNISFAIPEDCHVTLKIYNLLGRELLTIIDQDMQQGRHRITIKTDNLRSGVYVYRLTAGAYCEMRKFILLK